MKTYMQSLFKLVLWLILISGAQAQAAELITFYHNDIIGSPIAATDEFGNTLWAEQYRPYGERAIYDSQSGENPLWYTGKPEDSTTGLSYFGARYYDPVLGRFMGIDPVGFQEGNIHSFNRYAYANNNPYRYVDPDGRSAIIRTIRLAFNGGDVAATFSDVVKDFAVLTSSSASIGARTFAAASIASEALPVSVGDLKILGKVAKSVTVSRGRFPQSAKHIQDAVASGKPNTLTINRAGATANRKDSLRGVNTKPGLDRDEFPPAMFKEGGKGASVRHINRGDNRGAGACIGAQCRGLSNGTRVRIDVVD